MEAMEEKNAMHTPTSKNGTGNGMSTKNVVGLKKPDTRFQTPQAAHIDIDQLEKDLVKTITGEVRFDTGSRSLYSTDSSNYKQVPIGVVLPKNEEDIFQTIKICNRYGAPILSRGGGTSLAGQCCNVAVVMDMSKYFNRVLNIDKERKLVTVEAGIVLDEMRCKTEKETGLTFGPDPSTHTHCTLGGMLGNNSCGIHSVMAALEGNGARTSDNTESMNIITYDGIKMVVGATTAQELEQIIAAGGRRGEIYKKLRLFTDKYAHLIREKFPNIPRRVSGYNLPALLPENGFNIAQALVGSESTLVTITQATLKLIPKPKASSLLVLGYDSLPNAGYAAPFIMKHKPIGLEGIDDLLIEFMKKKGLNVADIPLLPKGKAWLLVEFGGDSKEESDGKAKALINDLNHEANKPTSNLFDDPEQEEMLWKIRESGLGATAWVPGEPNGGPGWEDSAVPPEKIGDYLKELRELFTKYQYFPSMYGHFGQGCVHCRVSFDFLTEEGLKKYKQFTVEASHLVVKYGGSLSGEHGDGQSRGDLLEIMYGKELVRAFSEFKEIWDPGGKMNPGKMVDTYGQTNNLRLGTDYNPSHLSTHFQFPDEKYSFAHAANLCVGVGECRRHENGTMCPSYMVTRDEKDCTRGRARMLFEMMDGRVLKNGWKNKAVKESLDLCLACKGCKADCPVNVDMATYKSEFLSHYYAGRLRPRTAYFFGYIYWWSRMASRMPGLANFFLHTPVISRIVKSIGGIDQHRTLPKYAHSSFKKWFNQNKTSLRANNKVILWPDTFNNFFLPETLIAGREVLEAAGFDVMLPKLTLCCGRPLYDFGMLGIAKKMLLQILDALKEEIRADIPIVGLEPSCVAVFRDELCNLFPSNEDAKRLKKNVFTLAEFLNKKAPGFSIPPLNKKAIIHRHCHHVSVMKFDADKKLLKKMGLAYEILDSGCCGMAGYFGYEKGEHYEVSIKAGERILLPKVRASDDDTIIIADGFSCREQIVQQTGRKAMHMAEAIAMALRQDKKPDKIKTPAKSMVNT